MQGSLEGASNAPVLDERVFGEFAELLGDAMPRVLGRHLELSREAVATIAQALADQDFQLVGEQAHSLKSSSRQIGATALAMIAEALEKTCRADTVDAAQAGALSAALHEAQHALEIRLAVAPGQGSM